MQIHFAVAKVLQQQNMLNVHNMPTLVCELFKWNYEQHLYGHTFKSMVYIFASTNEPLITIVYRLSSYLSTHITTVLVLFTPTLNTFFMYMSCMQLSVNFGQP